MDEENVSRRRPKRDRELIAAVRDMEANDQQAIADIRSRRARRVAVLIRKAVARRRLTVERRERMKSL